MTCTSARQLVVALVREQLRADQTAAVRRHLIECGACHEEYEYQARLNSPLRDLSVVEPPPNLAMTIRIEASQQRRPGIWSRCLEQWQGNLADWMRPLALPAAGGLLTALILFGMLVPAVSLGQFSALRRAALNSDTPTGLSTDPRFKQASMMPVYEDLLVEAWIDGQGKVSGYQVITGPRPGSAEGKALEYQLGDVLLTTVFEPATYFGQPKSGKVLLSLKRITIRG